MDFANNVSKKLFCRINEKLPTVFYNNFIQTISTGSGSIN